MDSIRAKRKETSSGDGDSARYQGSVYCVICENERALCASTWVVPHEFVYNSCPNRDGSFIFI